MKHAALGNTQLRWGTQRPPAWSAILGRPGSPTRAPREHSRTLGVGAGVLMKKSHKRPSWNDAERAVKVLCLIVNEAIKLYATLRGSR